MSPSALLAAASRARREGRHARAIELCTVGLNEQPALDVERALRIERAEAEVAFGDWDAATTDCERVLAQTYATRVAVLLGRSLIERKELLRAQALLEHALVEEPGYKDAFAPLIDLYSSVGDHEHAVSVAGDAYLRWPGLSTFKHLLRALAAACRVEEIISRIETVLTEPERDAEIWTSLGYAHSALGRSSEAISAFRGALRLVPNYQNARQGLGYALLRQGDFTQGFAEHEFRQSATGYLQRFGIPPWRGECLSDKHLMVCSEQGLGDTLQFARYLPFARQLAGRTTFHVPSNLLRLFRSSEVLGPLASEHPDRATVDYQTLVMSLPHCLQLTHPEQAARAPYLFAEPELVRHWQARLPQGPKVAIAWQGNPSFAGEPSRSMPLGCLQPLVARHAQHYRFVSLQKGYGQEQIAACGFAGSLLDCGCEIDSGVDAFIDSLAILLQVECLITTDTSLAHLAGAANVRTWLLLPRVADWRWGIQGERTPWYPSMRLVRQPSDADWRSVIERMTANLCEPISEAARGI